MAEAELASQHSRLVFIHRVSFDLNVAKDFLDHLHHFHLDESTLLDVLSARGSMPTSSNMLSKAWVDRASPVGIV